MVNVCAKTVPDSTKLHVIKGPKSKISWESMPPNPPTLPHPLHTDTYLPPNNLYNLICPLSLGKKLKNTLVYNTLVCNCKRLRMIAPSLPRSL